MAKLRPSVLIFTGRVRLGKDGRAGDDVPPARWAARERPTRRRRWRRRRRERRPIADEGARRPRVAAIGAAFGRLLGAKKLVERSPRAVTALEAMYKPQPIAVRRRPSSAGGGASLSKSSDKRLGRRRHASEVWIAGRCRSRAAPPRAVQQSLEGHGAAAGTGRLVDALGDADDANPDRTAGGEKNELGGGAARRRERPRRRPIEDWSGGCAPVGSRARTEPAAASRQSPPKRAVHTRRREVLRPVAADVACAPRDVSARRWPRRSRPQDQVRRLLRLDAAGCRRAGVAPFRRRCRRPNNRSLRPTG